MGSILDHIPANPVACYANGGVQRIKEMPGARRATGNKSVEDQIGLTWPPGRPIRRGHLDQTTPIWIYPRYASRNKCRRDKPIGISTRPAVQLR